jgi:hypothetical protein
MLADFWRRRMDSSTLDGPSLLAPCQRQAGFLAKFRRTVLPRLWPVLWALIVVLLIGCSAPQVESAHFGPSADIERVIRMYYERHASEGGGRCFNPYIDAFTKLTVLEETPDRLVVDARYLHRDRFREGGSGEGGQICTGFAERTFTLARTPEDDPIVTEMSGERYEPAIRSLIRRVLPG